MYPSETALTTVQTLKGWLDSPPTGGVSSVVPASGGLGSGYTSTPTVTVTDTPGGNGTGAVVTAVVVANQVTSYIVTTKGQNYTSPQIVVSGGGGTGASANAFTWADAALDRLIGAVSSAIVSQLSIPTIFDSGSNIIEVHNGNWTRELALDVSPIISVSSLSIGSTAITLSDGNSSGYMIGTRPSDNHILYLIGQIFVRGTRNISVTYRGGEVLGSGFQRELEQWCLMMCARVWKKRSHEPNVSEQVAGIGTITFAQKDFPDLVMAGIKQRQRVMSYD